MPGLGMTKAAGYGAAAGGVMPGISLIHGVAFSLIARQGGKALTNPVNLRAFNQILKATDEDIANIYNHGLTENTEQLQKASHSRMHLQLLVLTLMEI